MIGKGVQYSTVHNSVFYDHPLKSLFFTPAIWRGNQEVHGSCFHGAISNRSNFRRGEGIGLWILEVGIQ